MITTTASMSFGLLTIVTSVFCGMLGPGLALRGHKGADSVHQAVDTMRDEFRNTLNYFIAQLTIFQISLLFKYFLLFRFTIAFGLAMIQFMFLIAFVVLGNQIFVKLYVQEFAALTGKINAEDAHMIQSSNIPNFGGNENQRAPGSRQGAAPSRQQPNDGRGGGSRSGTHESGSAAGGQH